jgi:hypothetical protein
MTTQYIELTSTYRNRAEFPKQARFSVSNNLSNGNLSLLTAQDPVSNAFPLYAGVVGLLNGSGTFNGGTYINPQLAPSSSTLTDAYKGYRLYDTTGTTGDRLVTGYTPTNTSTTLQLPFVSTAWASTDSYTITDESMVTANKLVVQPVDVFGKTPYKLMESLVGYTVTVYPWDGTKYTTAATTTTTTSYDTTLNTFTLASGGPFLQNDLAMIRKETYSENGLFQAGSGGNTITLSTTASSTTDYYKGKFLFIVPFNNVVNQDPGISTFSNYVYKIVAYNGTTKVATLDRAYSVSNYVQVVLGNMTDRLYEILDFSYDNAQNYFFSGSRLSQESSACSEVEIVDIILPNVPLKTGSRSALYPYFYVNVESTNSSFNSNTSIYSNNPNSRKVNFIAPMYDISNPFATSFIKLDSSMTPTLKFNPKEPLSFTLTLPDGTLFQTLEDDTQSPLPPNPLLQITVIVGVKRMT